MSNRLLASRQLYDLDDRMKRVHHDGGVEGLAAAAMREVVRALARVKKAQDVDLILSEWLRSPGAEIVSAVTGATPAEQVERLREATITEKER